MSLLSRQRSIRLLFFMLLPLLAAQGCGSDKKKNPVAPPPGGSTQFTQAEAVAQSRAAGAQAIALVQSIPVLAGGLHRPTGTGYGWNEEAQRWEWRYLWDQAGYEYDWFYTVQYLDGEGIPQQSASEASSIVHSMTGIGKYHAVNDGTVIDYDYTYAYGTTVSGLGGESLLMTGSGSWELDYRYTYGGQNYAYVYDVDWHTVDPGISVPPGGGCPTGSMRYDFAPYYTIITFDGSGSAVATLYDGSGTPVPGGGQTYPQGCAAP